MNRYKLSFSFPYLARNPSQQVQEQDWSRAAPSPGWEYCVKLDGVGPVDDRPSTNQLHHFVIFFILTKIKIKLLFKKIACDM